MLTIRFIEHNLASDEKLLYRVQPHWIVFFQPILFTLGLLLFINLFPTDVFLVYIAFPVVLAVWAMKYIEFTCNEFGVTNKRVLKKTGLIRIDVTDTPFQRIESIHVSQSLLGKILGYGNVTIRGTGGDWYPFPWIRKPLLFRSYIQEQMNLLGTT